MEVRILKVIRRMLCMCDPAWELLMRGLQLALRAALLQRSCCCVDAGELFRLESCGTYSLAA